MATKRIFVSFDYDNDKHYKNLLLAWSANDQFADFYISDQSVTEPVDSDRAGPIRRAISAKIGAATGLLCIVGKSTSKCRWAFHCPLKNHRANPGEFCEGAAAGSVLEAAPACSLSPALYTYAFRRPPVPGP